MKKRHIPIRTCVACRQTDEKRDLMRVVRQPDGSVAHDPKGKMSGRGAYICVRAECIAQARKRKALERSLKVSGISEELFTDLMARAASREAVAVAVSGTEPTTVQRSAPDASETAARAPQESEGETE